MGVTSDLHTLPAKCRHRFPIFEKRVYVNSCSQGALASLTAAASRPAEPASGGGSPRWRHDALRARVTHTVPSGLAPPAGRQETEGRCP
jgi:hypothetical protein